MLTREIGAAQLVVTTAVLTADEPWQQLASSDVERRGALLYVDNGAPGPAYLADSEQHARNQSGGAPFYPTAFPPGFELGVSGGVWVYALPGDLAGGEITVYLVAEVGQAADHA